MATLPTTVLPKVGKTYQGAAAGQPAGWANAQIGGDLIPLTGPGTVVRFKTAGTICVWTIDSTVLSSYGVDQDITVTLAATDEQEITIPNDGRFDQGVNGNPGYAKATPSTVTGVPQIAAKIIPT